MKEILDQRLKKMILNYLGFRFSKQRRPLSSFRVGVIIFEEKIELDNEMNIISKWKEVV